MSEVAWFSAGAWFLVVLCGALFRSRAYAIFRGVLLGIHTLIAVQLIPFMGVWTPIFFYFHAVVYLDSLLLVRPTLRPRWYRMAIVWPSHYAAAATFMAFPWAIVSALGFPPYGFFVPYLLGVWGIVQSLTARTETLQVEVGAVQETFGLQRVSKGSSIRMETVEALRIAQITDPHLGPFMSVARLRGICERVVQQKPDLVFLTGDFLTMETQRESSWLLEALAPLTELEGKVFACLGNHDHEAPETVKTALSGVGAHLLVDEATDVETRLGTVEVIGFDFHFRERRERMNQVIASFPRKEGVVRLALLHDPGAFRFLPPGEAELVFSGHTHGGQVGLVSLGLMWTIVGWLAKMPDHGLWGNGTNRLYVHRGTGHYGFPLRLGVPAEESIVSLVVRG